MTVIRKRSSVINPAVTRRSRAQRWQEMQLSPLSGCFSVAAWQDRQFKPGLCQAGMGGAVLWPGVDLWQTKQLPLVCSGRWHPVQCRFLGQSQPAVWETGAVSWWHRSHPSLV